MSAFIAIEGLDGSGKSTQIDLLIKHLAEKGVRTQFVHFPRLNEGIFGELIAKFLRGEFGEVSQVHPQLVATIFAEDRRAFSPTIREWLSQDNFVLVDRYVLSNIAFQCAKLKVEAEKKQLRDWIVQLEYEHNQIPKPDFSIYLDVPFDFITRSLEARRQNRDRSYLNDKNDIHENDYALQRAVKNEYDSLCMTDPSIHRIGCASADQQMRSIDEIHREIVNVVARKL